MVLVDTLGDPIEDLSPKEFRQQNFFLRLAKNLLLIIFFSSVVFVTINLPAYIIIGEYKINPTKFAFEANVQKKLEQADTFGQYKPTVQYPDNSLFIPKIGVNVPVIYDVGSEDIMESLRDGVVHLVGSGHIGDGKNIFVTGHSSNYWWEKGNYNTVFALLPNLNTGDEIYLTDHGKLRRYLVQGKTEVSKNEVDNYLDSEKEQLTLMTCVPVGTNLRRLLIIASPN